ncbi:MULTISPECIES: hypothetical protein [unclassified Ornithinimicrobium]|uniref:hypothetical protein n=1 Tax=unclassified Ornithinimicrobium TaxID=2615080 RepID=UPI003854D641
MHQPGVVPLRPLTVGDIFNGALQTMRRNPQATIGAALVVLVVLLVPSLLASLAVTRWAGLAVEDQQVAALGINGLSNALASVALTGMIVYVVSEAVLGDKVDLAETWTAVRGRLPALVGNLLLIVLLLVLAAAVFVLGVVALALGAPAIGDGWLVALVVLATLGLVVALVWAACRVGLAPCAVVLERAGPWRAIRRVWSLTSGWQAWRIVGITLLAGVLTGIFTTAVQVPVSFVTMGVMGSLSEGLSPVAPAVLVVDHVVQLVVSTLVIPFTAGVTALLYLDQRIRREGLDLALGRAAQARAAGRAR